MDPLLLNYYERELGFIHEMGAEFASEYPKIAGRLGMDGVSVSDPYVERLMESFAFLTARVHLKIDAEYPKFTQNLLNIIYPHYLTPIPSMAMVELCPSDNVSFEEGFELPRHSSMRSNLLKGEQTACEFRTSRSVSLWPVTISEATYFSNISAYSGFANPGKKVKAGLVVKLQTNGGLMFHESGIDELSLFLSGQASQSMRIYEQLFGNLCGFIVQSTDKHNLWEENIGTDSVLQLGFADEEALLPDEKHTFSGYRLLREYFSFPQQFLFVKCKNLNKALKRCAAESVNLIFLFDRYDAELENRVTVDDFKLFCTPVINLFSRRLDRIHLSDQKPEYHLVADRTRPLDFEIFSIESVKGYGTSLEEQREFLPFYACNDRVVDVDELSYFTVRRERRIRSNRQKSKGTRSSYLGSETYIGLVDGSESHYDSPLKQLEVKALCTNRDLPLQIPLNKSGSDFSLEGSAPADSIKCLGIPSRPKPSIAHKESEISWRLINQLSLNYLSLTGSRQGGDPSCLRELLMLYADNRDAVQMRQIEGITSIQSEQVTRRIPIPGPISFGRGLRITIGFDESAFAGSGVFLLGSILEQFFARYVSINSFTETVIRSEERGEIKVWPVRLGKRELI